MVGSAAGWWARPAAATCTRITDLSQICGFDPCKAPVAPVTQSLWGELQPADTLDISGRLPDARDLSYFNDGQFIYATNPFYQAIDIQQGTAFTAMDYGVKVWDVSAGGPPHLLGAVDWRGFPFWDINAHYFTPLQDISLPAGNASIGAVVGYNSLGTAILDFSSAANPRVIYQDPKGDGTAVYAAGIGGINYAFSAVGPSLEVYNMDAARQLAAASGRACNEQAGSCPGVHVGIIGTRRPQYVAGVDHFLVVSNGSSPGVDVWDVANPANPTLKLTALGDVGVFGVAMWNSGGTYYLAARTGPSFLNASAPQALKILNVSCITGSCGAAPPLVSTYVDTSGAAGAQSYYLTLSFSGNTPFLYLGSDQKCGGKPINQREWLLDVSNPGAPRDITPPSNSAGGYWGWYYMENGQTGFNWIMPRHGKFWGQYFYRTAQSVFDTHKHVGAVAPGAAFAWNPAAIYPGTPINFADQSSGQPASWSWTFAPDGNPQTSSQSSPAGVTFATAGTKQVTLTVINPQGNNQVTQNVVVLNAQPQVASVSVSPASPLQCQPVTLTANGVTGQPPLTWAWAITNNNGNTTAPGGTSTSPNSFVWDTKANAAQPGSYTAKVTVNNSTGSPASAQGGFTLGPLPSLPLTFTPANDPFSNGTVQFHANVSGATEWNWNFGDGAGFIGWTTDPISGPGPTHSYTATGTYNVQVMVRNCVNLAGVTSAVLAVKVTQVSPLVASFSPDCSSAPCTVTVNTPLSFTDASQGASFWDYDWDGTGTFSDANHTAPVTSHTYTNAGTTGILYHPALRVRRGTSEQNTYTYTAGVFVSPAVQTQPPQISVSGPISGSPGQAYTFAASASNCTPAAIWSWSVSGGGTVGGSSTDSSITITWAGTGNFSVTASNSGCSGASGTAGINISSGNTGGALHASYVYSPSTPAAGQSVSFDGSASAGNPTGYQWFFGDGSTGSGATTTHTYTQPGSYVVKLDVQAPGNCQFNICIDEATQTVVVTGGASLHSSFVFSPGAPTTGQNVSFDGSSSTGNPTAYSWFFGDGTTGNGVTASHVFTQPGSYQVKLDVSAPGSGASCQAGTCVDESIKTVVVAPQTTFNPDFTSPSCSTQTAPITCATLSGVQVTLTAAETNPAASFAWDFGDGTTGSGSPVNHTFQQAGNFTVALTVTGKGFTPATKSYLFIVSPNSQPTFQTVVLPWVAATRGALVQSCDLYLHNPGTSPLPVTLKFLKRGLGQNPPPQATATIQPGATMYAPDVLQGTFQRDNTSGFVTVTVKSTDPLPIMTSFNTVTRSDGAHFGQTVPGQTFAGAHASAASSGQSTFQDLVGLNDNGDQLAYFGITNPSSTLATYHVRLFDNSGHQIGESNGDMTLGPFSQRQFQQADVHNLFGLTSASDYRVEIENKTAASLVPYGENVRLGSGDPSFLTVGSSSAATQYVIGAFSTDGRWQSDVVLANTSSQPMTLALTFTRTGVFQSPTRPVALTLNPGQTQRLSNAIAGQWGLSNVVGVITVASVGAGGVYPSVQAESYNTANPSDRFGQQMRAFSDADVAAAGHGQYLVGLRQDADHLTTFWVFNPGTTGATIDLVYRALDGTVLGTLSNLVLPAGKVRQWLPEVHPLPSGGATNGFTVQVVVKSGNVLAAAQVLTISTGDPAYVQGAAH